MKHFCYIKELEHLSGMKVMFNMIFQSEKIQEMFVRNGLLMYMIKHVDATKKDIPIENMTFLLKIFFITTAIYKEYGYVLYCI